MGLQLLNNMDLFLCNFNLYLVCYYPKLFSICMLFLETFWKQPLWAPNMSFWKSFLPVSLQTQESLQVSKISQSYFVSIQKRLIRISLEPCFCNSNFCARHINGFGVHIVDFFFFFFFNVVNQNYWSPMSYCIWEKSYGIVSLPSTLVWPLDIWLCKA